MSSRTHGASCQPQCGHRGDVLAANLEPRHAREHALYDTVAQSHAKFKDGNPTAAMDLHKVRELFELGRGEGIWMSVAQRVDRRAYVPLAMSSPLLAPMMIRSASARMASRSL